MEQKLFETWSRSRNYFLNKYLLPVLRIRIQLFRVPDPCYYFLHIWKEKKNSGTVPVPDNQRISELSSIFYFTLEKIGTDIFLETGLV